MKLLFRPDRPEDKKMVNDYLDALTEPTWIETKKITKHKSRGSEDYYWRVIVRPLAESVGYSKNEEDQLHEWFLNEFSFKMTEGPDGKTYKRVIRSSNKEEFDVRWQLDYYEAIRIWAKTELNFHIPVPNEEANVNIDKQFKPLKQ